MTANPDVVVIGAGAFGAWTALSLIERGASVLLVDAHGPGHAFSSSGGESRNIRAAYGVRDLYTRWSIAAWAKWQAREAEFGQRLLYPSGSLRMLTHDAARVQAAVFDRCKHPYAVMSAAEVRARWPQIGYQDAEWLLHEPKSGTLAATVALQAVATRVRQLGAIVMHGRVAPPTGSGRLRVVTIGRDLISASQFVFACGPWLPKLFPALLGPLIRTPRRELFFIGPAAGDLRYHWRHCPSLADPLGWTSSDLGGGVKIAPVIRHVPMDPDNRDRTPTPALLPQMHGYIARRLPGLVGRPIVATYVSQLENTASEDFLIDRHPDFDNVFVAGGGSGHAFKMGPVIGEHVAGFVIDGAQAPPLAAVFAIANHAPLGPGDGG